MLPFTPLSLTGFTVGVNLLDALRSNDIVGFLCILLLLVLSVFSGYVMLAKFWEIKHASVESEDFIEDCLEGSKSLPEIFKAASAYPSSPLASLLREAYVEYETEIQQDTAAALPLEQRIQLSKTSVESALERTMASELRKLEGRLIHIATVSTLAPFIGLFGTVWGVLAAFQGLAREGNASLATLAPGISTALLTTIFGLLVAIPAVAMYNYLAGNVARLSSQMESFAHELSNVFQKHLLRRGQSTMRRRISVQQPVAHINVTSLLDIVFVLLISFMVVAPAMMHGIDLELPKVKDAPTLKQDKPIAITVPYKPGTPEVRVQGKVVPLNKLVAEIHDAAGGDETRPVTLEGDGRVDWELIAQVITELRSGGVVNIGILTDLEKS